MRVLVTGASSLIGQHVVKLLLERRYEVTAVQRGEVSIDGVSNVSLDLSTCSVSDEASSRLSTALEGQDAVVHLAAKVSVSGKWDEFNALNVLGTQSLINASLACQVSRFVHISSPSVAHAGKSLIGAEAGIANVEHARGHYARSKAMGELIALGANSEAMKVVCLRPHLVWGPGDTQLVQRIVDRARAGRLVLVGSGQALIDTTYIDNAATAIVAGLDHIDSAAGHSLVISNGQPRTVCEILQRILVAAGLPVHLKKIPAAVATNAGGLIESAWNALNAKGDPPMTRFMAEQLATAHWFSQRDTTRLLNWTPAISLEEGFVRLAEHMRQGGQTHSNRKG